MRPHLLRLALLGVLLTLSLSTAATPVRAATQNAPAGTDDDDDGFDEGLLGLLGLAGLLGLRRRDRTDVNARRT